MSNPLRSIKEHGQSIWLDNLSRQMLEDGSLERLIKEDGISGVTSNPAIFEKASTKGEAYDKQLKTLQEQGLGAQEMYEAVAVRDIQSACDLLRPTYEDANGTDGFVSLEVNPHLARDTRGTVQEAARLWEAVDRPNVMIKIPGTQEGVPAIRECLTRGININITLLFSLNAYDDVMEAHLAAMEERLEKGHAAAPVASVASFFLSRIDVMVDKMLDKMDNPKAKELRGEAAVASAKLAYQQWKERYGGERWEALAERGARVQKPLWASTSTKDDSYSDVKYVEPLIGPQTINTLPDETVDAFRDHGKVATTVEDGVDQAKKVMSGLKDLGIDIDEVTDKLVEEGIEKFNKPFDSLLDSLKEKSKALASG